VLAQRDKLVNLNANGIIHLATAQFAQALAGNSAHRGQTFLPVVNPDKVVRHAGKHLRDFGRGHRPVRAQGRQELDGRALHQKFVQLTANLAGPGMKA